MSRRLILVILIVLAPLGAHAQFGEDVDQRTHQAGQNQAAQDQSPWSFLFATTAARGLDELADTWLSRSSLNAEYQLDPRQLVGVATGYETILYRAHGQLLSNYDVDPGRYGLNNTSLYYQRPKIWSDSHNVLGLELAATLPTSRLWQRATVIGEVSSELALRYQVLPKLQLVPRLNMYLRAHRYDDADKAGFIVNSPFGIGAGLGGAYSLSPWLAVSAGYSLLQRYEYHDYSKSFQTANVRLTARPAPKMSVFAEYRWQDRIVTNEPLFDDDKSQFAIGLSVGYP